VGESSAESEIDRSPSFDGRRFRVRVNGQWAGKLPVASKTIVIKQVRGWLMKH